MRGRPCPRHASGTWPGIHARCLSGSPGSGMGMFQSRGQRSRWHGLGVPLVDFEGADTGCVIDGGVLKATDLLAAFSVGRRSSKRGLSASILSTPSPRCGLNSKTGPANATRTCSLCSKSMATGRSRTKSSICTPSGARWLQVLCSSCLPSSVAYRHHNGTVTTSSSGVTSRHRPPSPHDA